MVAQRSQRIDGLPSTDRYAPGCRIEIEDKELAPEIIADILQVNVTLELDALAQFSLTVNNWDSANFGFKYTERKTVKDANGEVVEVGMFDLGHRVHVQLGYAGEMTSLIRGVITTMSPRFPESGSPTIGITGLDSMFLLRDRKPGGAEQKKWTKKRDSDIARDIAARNKLAAHVDDTLEEHPLIWQTNQDDARFLLDRAHKNDFDCYIGIEGQGAKRRDTLFFVRPRDGRTGAAQRQIDFEWGRNLISFNPTLTLSRQVAKVTVRGWNSRDMEPISETATAADLPKTEKSGTSGAALVAERLGAKQEIVVDQNPATKEEAKRIAVAMLVNRSYEFITATMSVMGNPTLRPGDNIFVSRLGARFDGKYYIVKAEHTFGAAGYLTQLTVRRLYQPPEAT